MLALPYLANDRDRQPNRSTSLAALNEGSSDSGGKADYSEALGKHDEGRHLQQKRGRELSLEVGQVQVFPLYISFSCVASADFSVSVHFKQKYESF